MVYMEIDENEDFKKYVEGKRVAYVGPSPHLIDQSMGELIDSYDIVFKVNEAITSPKDYGARMDVVVNCLNNDYAPLLGDFMSKNPDITKNMKFVVCGESLLPDPKNLRIPDTMGNYNKYIKSYGVPIYILSKENRVKIFKEIGPKRYTEGEILNTANFNNGYAGILMLLRHNPKEVFVTGINFYNFGQAKGIFVNKNKKGFKEVFKETKELTDGDKRSLKYHDSYINYYKSGKHRDYLGGNYTVLHDQLAQIAHFRDVVVPGHPEVLKIDQHLQDNLFTKKLDDRIKWHKTLPE